MGGLRSAGRKDGELSIPGVASPGGAGYDFWSNQLRIGWRGGRMDWVRLLPFVTGMVDQELLARNEYLAAENRILKARLKGRLKLSDAERATLGEIGHRLGRKILGEVASVAQPDTILAWYRKLVARKFDGSKARRSPGRPRIKRAVEQLIVRMAKENRDWGYDRIWPIWGMRSVIRRSGMSCNATACRPHPSARQSAPPGAGRSEDRGASRPGGEEHKRVRTGIHERFRAAKLRLTTHAYCSRSHGPKGCSVSL
jgi:hypothetical protein